LTKGTRTETVTRVQAISVFWYFYRKFPLRYPIVGIVANLSRWHSWYSRLNTV